LPKVKVLSGARAAVSTSGRPAPLHPAVARTPLASLPTARVDILAVGASTGGPNALATLFANLAKPVAVPIVVVQHMPPLFTRLLAQRLTASCGLPVHEAQHGDVLQPGQAWIAPGGSHMTVASRGGNVVVELNQDPPENSCRPAVDVLFRSVADVFGGRTLAVVLTGMGQDGLRGCERIDREGGQIVVQDEASSVVWGMPGYIARAGIADAVLPVDALHIELGRRLHRLGRGAPSADQR
jgi:two-component system chemotaxis response regulator CheB